MARDIILNLAISLDGFICDEDGGFAWISGQGDVRADTADHFDFDGFLVLLCKQAAKIFQTICKKETALKRVLRNLLSAISFAQI